MLPVLFLSSPFLRLVLTCPSPFLYSLCPFGFKWSSYHIEWFNRTIKPYLRVLFFERLLTLNRTGELSCFILKTEQLLVYLTQTRIMSQNVLKENNMTMTQPTNIFVGCFTFLKKYFF